MASYLARPVGTPQGGGERDGGNEIVAWIDWLPEMKERLGN